MQCESLNIQRKIQNVAFPQSLSFPASVRIIEIYGFIKY